MSIAQVQHRAQIRSINTYNAGAVHFQSVIHITFYLHVVDLECEKRSYYLDSFVVLLKLQGRSKSN